MNVCHYKPQHNLRQRNIPYREKQTLTEHLQLAWVDEAHQESTDEQEAAAQTVSGETLILHLLEKIIDRYAREFIGIQETRYLIDSIESNFAELLKELQRQLSISQIAEIFQRLASESVSLKNLRTIFESLVEWSQKEKDILLLTEYVRISLQRYLTYTYSQGKPDISVFMVGDDTEKVLREAIRQTDTGAYLALTPEQTESLTQSISDAVNRIDYGDQSPVFLTSMDVRRYLRKLLESKFYDIPVVSYQELSRNIKVNVLTTV